MTTSMPGFSLAGFSRLFDQPRLTVSSFLCKPEFVRWRRTHRRARLRKKFRKKYGAIYHCRGHAYRVGGQLVVCPCVAAELRKL